MTSPRARMQGKGNEICATEILGAAFLTMLVRVMTIHLKFRIPLAEANTTQSGSISHPTITMLDLCIKQSVFRLHQSSNITSYSLELSKTASLSISPLADNNSSQNDRPNKNGILFFEYGVRRLFPHQRQPSLSQPWRDPRPSKSKRPHQQIC